MDMLSLRLANVLIFSGLCFSATGCVCVSQCGQGRRMPIGDACSTGCASPCDDGCGSCSSCDDCGSAGGLFRPFGGLFGCGGCRLGCGTGCGEVYIGEWLNERPTVDNCGCGQCQTYGRTPVRSLLRMLLGDACQSDCDTCCDGGFDLNAPILQDGYEESGWSPHRVSCSGNCSSCSGSTVSHSQHHQAVPAVQSEQINQEQLGVPPVPTPVPGGAGVHQPTPAPPVPKSALRLNPATRKVIR